MSGTLRITGGRVYDPANGIDGVVRDVLVRDGTIVEALPADASEKTIDARGMVIMPGGVDIHCHIASASVNRARAMQGEEHATHVHPRKCSHPGTSGHAPFRSGSGVLTPSTFTTGYRYAALGYTTAIEAAVAPSGARHTQLELEDTPNLDAGFLLLLANHQRLIELIDRGDTDVATAFIGAMLARTGAYGIKVVNPGGVHAWRNDPAQRVIDSIDDRLGSSGVTPRRILETVCAAAERYHLPHPPHVHCNRLGVPGNVETTLATLEALDGRRAHLTHLQFHAYAKSKRGDFADGAARLCDYLNTNPNITADVGQVMFGEAMTLTADTPLEYTLWKLTGQRYTSIEIESETGCGLMPMRYRDTQYLHSLQWAIGLELMLGCSDPWRMFLSTDHPNGGSFLAYPAIIAQLMSRSLRQEQMARAHPRAMRRCALKDMDRELTLSEIAIVTRAGPARALGLAHKGQLGAGADADITIYDDDPADRQRMFQSPRYVIKAGRVLVREGELIDQAAGRQLRAAIPDGAEGLPLVRQWFEDHGSYDFAQFGVMDA